MRNLYGKAALLTGASGGIGRALAAALAQNGVNLALCGRNAKALHEVCMAVQAAGVQAIALPGDLTEDAYLRECVQKTVEQFGALDILINNAGEVLSKPLDVVTPAEYDHVMAVNARAPFFLCQAALPHLRASKGAILNIGSVVSHKGYPDQSVYAASKHALLGFTKSLAAEVYKDGVRVHVLSPGGVLTGMVTRVRPDIPTDDLILPEEIAETALFLLTRNTCVVDEIEAHRPGKQPFA